MIFSTFTGGLDFFVPKWPLAVARDLLREKKKSRPPLKVSIFHGPHLVMALVMDFPARK